MAKLAASILSGSMSIISSLVDSVVDLLSGVIMWWAARAIKRRNIYDYPQGETALSRMCKPPSQEPIINQGYLRYYPQCENALSRVSHKARSLQFARAIYVIIHRVRQRCHILATKSIAIKRRNIYDYPQGETALSRVSHRLQHSRQETVHL